MAVAGFPGRRRKGGALVYTAIVLFVLVGFAGLAIDWGYMTWTAQKLQNTADAAALAGAQQVWWSHLDARNAAIAYAAKNEAGGKMVKLTDNPDNNPSGEIIIGQWDKTAHTFTPTLNHNITNAVRVLARRTTGSADGALPLIFGPIFNKNTAEVYRYAIAFAIGGPAKNSVIALNTNDPKSFYIAGNGYMDLGDGAAQVDSSNNAGAVFQGTSLTFIAGQANMVGAWDEKGNPRLNSVDLQKNQPYVADPLAGLAEFVPGSPMTPPKITGAQHTYNPGYYPKGLSIINSGDNVVLNPGVYILENGNSKKPSLPAFNMAGGKLTANGVMFFIKFGNVEWNGNSQIFMTPMSEAQSLTFTGIKGYAGIQFFQARNNTQEAHFNGNSLFTGTAADVHSGAGALYFPVAKVYLNGNGDMYLDSVIADKIETQGSGRKFITKGYDGRKGGDAVYLVE